MEIKRHRTLPGSLERAFALVDDLAMYPRWMGLVHDVAPASPASQEPEHARAWNVELQAHVGPFARSKRLRMLRTVHRPPHEVVFERREIDDREHSPWVLRATLHAGLRDGVDLTMQLTYGGSLWTGAVLQRVLDDHVERGATALADLLAADAVEG